MADEMDDSRDKEEIDPVPEHNVAKGMKTSSNAEVAGERSAEATEARASGTDPEIAEAKVGEASSDPLNSAKKTGASSIDDPEAFEPSAARGDRDEQNAQAAPAKPANGTQSAYAVLSDLDKPGLELLYDVELDATLQFGSKEMLLRDVLELGPGDVVELDRHIAEPVDLVVGDRIVARGEVVIASGNFALRVTEVATPQMRLESIRCLF